MFHFIPALLVLSGVGVDGRRGTSRRGTHSGPKSLPLIDCSACLFLLLLPVAVAAAAGDDAAGGDGGGGDGGDGGGSDTRGGS